MPAGTKPAENDIHQVSQSADYVLNRGYDTIPQRGEDLGNSLPEGIPVPCEQSLEYVEETSDDSEHSFQDYGYLVEGSLKYGSKQIAELRPNSTEYLSKTLEVESQGVDTL